MINNIASSNFVDSRLHSAEHSSELDALLETLFTDAEVGEDVVEDFGGGDDATGDGGKGIETLTKIFTQKVAGEILGKTIKNAHDALLGLLEGGVVTGGGDDGIVFSYLGNA